jgi:hypothetical protein
VLERLEDAPEVRIVGHAASVDALYDWLGTRMVEHNGAQEVRDAAHVWMDRLRVDPTAETFEQCKRILEAAKSLRQHTRTDAMHVVATRVVRGTAHPETWDAARHVGVGVDPSPCGVIYVHGGSPRMDVSVYEAIQACTWVVGVVWCPVAPPLTPEDAARYAALRDARLLLPVPKHAYTAQPLDNGRIDTVPEPAFLFDLWSAVCARRLVLDPTSEVLLTHPHRGHDA